MYSRNTKGSMQSLGNNHHHHHRQQSSGSNSNDAELSRPSSRLASFSPFRRSNHFSSIPSIQNTNAPSSSPNPSFSSGWSASQSDMGGVGDVPNAFTKSQTSSSSSRLPFKPPKPAALRVKKAKALSISLLGGSGSNNHADENQASSSSARYNQIKRVEPPKTSIPLSTHRFSTTPSTMTLQEALAAEDGGNRYPSMPGRESGRLDMPPRSASALDFYRANGPMKGLSQHAFPSPLIDSSPQIPALDDDDEIDWNSKQISIETTNTSPKHHQRRRSASFSSDHKLVPEKPLHSAPLQPSPSGWRLDTARELLSASSGKGFSSGPPTQSASAIDGNNYFTNHQSQSYAHLPLQSNGAGVTASPFLNTFNAQAKLHHPGSEEILEKSYSPPSRIPKRKAVPAPLGKADILRSTHRTSSDSSGPSSPRSPYSTLPNSPRRSPTSHRRMTSSESTFLATNIEIAPKTRQRSYTHAFGAPSIEPSVKEVNTNKEEDNTMISRKPTNVSETSIPQHPLYQRAEASSNSQGSSNSSVRTNRASSILPPPMRKAKLTRLGTQESLEQRSQSRYQNKDERYKLPGMANGSSNQGNGASLQGWGQQIGGMGAAVGRRGWDMFKQWNQSHNNSQQQSPFMQNGKGGQTNRTSMTESNEATRKWLSALEGPQSVGKASGLSMGGGVFGMPLRQAVLSTRLGRTNSDQVNQMGRAQITALDLGSEFKIDLPNLKSSPSSREFKGSKDFFSHKSVDRQEARLNYLPGLVVRCIESIESFGIQEEGIYRLSGRSSHTTKLRQIFDAPLTRRNGSVTSPDLRLAEIGPADLDLNSICSLLKSYLRELPEHLIPEEQTRKMNAKVVKECGIQAVGQPLTAGLAATKPNLSSGLVNADIEQAMAMKKASEEVKNAQEEQSLVSSSKIAESISSFMSELPAANWYLLRELTFHLADLTEPKVVERTRMTLNNLCLVLAPTLSLSVSMMRALVEEREFLFGQTCPKSDVELDNLNVQPSNLDLTKANLYQQKGLPSPPIHFARSQALRAPIGDSNRLSVATVTDKRQSVSSIKTLQPIKMSSNNKTINQENEESSPLESHFVQSVVVEEDDPDPYTSPIAAQYVRQRKASIAGSLDCLSLHSDGSKGSGGGKNINTYHHIIQPTTPNSIQSPRLTQIQSDRRMSDHDSIYSSVPSYDEFSSAASSLGASTSSGSIQAIKMAASDGELSSPLLQQNSDRSLLSSSASSISALDRPRPPTGGGAKIFATKPIVKSTNLRHRRKGSDASTGNLSVNSITNSAHSNGSNEGPTTPIAQRRDMITTEINPLINVNLIEDDEEEGAKTARASPDDQRMVDDSPMDVNAVRQYWSKGRQA